MVLELLVLRGRRTEERAAGHHQVGTLQIERLVDEEVLLLGSKRNRDLLVTLAEAMHQTLRRCGERLHRTEERRLLVERLARIGAEGGRDAQGRAVAVALDERGRGRIPRRVAARLEGRTDATRREARGIRLADDQVLARERHHGFPVLQFQEGIVLLGRRAGERQEPVGVVRRTAVHRPMAHGMRDLTGNRRIKRLAVVNRLHELLPRVLRKVFAHRLAREHVFRIADVLHPFRCARHLGLECRNLLRSRHSGTVAHLLVSFRSPWRTIRHSRHRIISKRRAKRENSDSQLKKFTINVISAVSPFRSLYNDRQAMPSSRRSSSPRHDGINTTLSTCFASGLTAGGYSGACVRPFTLHLNRATLKRTAFTSSLPHPLNMALLCVSPSAPLRQCRPSGGTARKAQPASARASSPAKVK